MARKLFFTVFLAIGVSLSACTSLNREFVKTMDRGLEPIEQDYVFLLEEKSGYDEETIRIRKGLVEKLREDIEEAKKE